MAAIVPETVYTKTAKGILEARNKAAKLPRELSPVFQAIDGRATVGEILPRLGLTSPQLHQALNTLASDGYIKAVASSVPPAAVPAPPADAVEFGAGTAASQLNMEVASHALAEAEAGKQAQQEARTALDARLRADAEARARALAEMRVQAEAEARSKAEVAARAAADARAEAEREAGAASDPAARAAAESRARAAAGAAVRAEAEARARSEAEARARALVDEKKAAEARAREEAQLHEKNQADAQARAAGEARARQSVEARMNAIAHPGQPPQTVPAPSSAVASEAPQPASAPPQLEVQGAANAPAAAETRQADAPPEIDLSSLAQQLTARVHAERRARDEADRKHREGPATAGGTDHGADSSAFPTLQLAPNEVAEPPSAPKTTSSAHSAEAELPSLSFAPDTGPGDVRHITPDHVPSALERAMTQTAARSEAEQVKPQEPPPPAEKKQTAAEASAARTAPHVVNLKPRASAAGATETPEPSLADDEPVHERLNVERTAHDIMVETAEARRRAEAADLMRSAAAARRQRVEEEARRTAKVERAENRKQGTRALTFALIGLPAVAIAFLQFVPLNTYIPEAQQALSQRLNQPTTISTLRYVLLPSPRIVLEGVRIGSGQDVRVDRVDAYAWPTTLMSDPKVFDQVDVTGVTIDQAMLAAIPSWTGGRSATAVHAARLKLSEVKLSIPDSGLEGLAGDITFEPNGTIKQAILNNENLKIELTPQQSGLRVVLNARDWRAPFGPAVPFSFLSIDGVADKQHFGTTALSGRVGGGAFTGTLAARWEGPLIVGGEFKLQGAKIDELAPLAVPDLKMRGTLSAAGRYALQSDSASGVLGKPLLEATFSITRGELTNVDLPRAMQGAGSLRGGRTAFDELSGSLQVNGKQFVYRQLQLASGPLNARGNLEVSPSRQLSGRVDAEFAARGSVVARSSFRVTGTVKEPQIAR